MLNRYLFSVADPAVPRLLRSRRVLRVDEKGARCGTFVCRDHGHREVEAEARQQARGRVSVALPQTDSLQGSLEAGVCVCVLRYFVIVSIDLDHRLINEKRVWV